MKKFIVLFLLCFMCQGCSLIKVLASPFKSSVNTTPQSTEKSREIIRCKGDLSIDPDGSIVCSKGFYKDGRNSLQTDRKLSFREKVGQFISNGASYLVWGGLIAVILSASGFGWVISAIFQGVFGVGRTLKQVMNGIQDARKHNKDINQALAESTDEDTKKVILKLKQKNNIK